MKQLIAAQADVHRSREDGASPILVAAQHAHDHVVKLLLDANANPNDPGWHNIRPMDLAMRTPDNADLLAILRDAGGRPSNDYP